MNESVRGILGPAPSKIAMNSNKKQALLNKFLSKTYHMIDQCDPSVASWCSDGDSFIIKDVDEFAKNLLPRYFKHSKFPSFVRQLNFYSFRKLRSDPDVRSSSKSVRFAHDYFRKGQPELLHNIHRITKSQDASSVEIKSLRDDIAKMNQQLESLSSSLDMRLKKMATAVESDYQQRMTSIALSYQALANLAKRMNTNTPSAIPLPLPPPPSAATSGANGDSCGVDTKTMTAPASACNTTGCITPTLESKGDKVALPTSPKSTASPLMTLSGVAAMICDRMSCAIPVENTPAKHK